MENIIIRIGASSDSFGGYAENCDGIYGAGDTLEECKKNTLEGLELLKKSRPMEEWPEILKGEYSITFKFDTQSLLKYYSGIFSKAALERLTGINQKQLHHYALGLRHPREERKKQIEDALHKLGEELLSVKL